MLSPPATTDVGRRIKALVVQHCQTDDLSDPVEFITGEAMSDLRGAQILINELLGLKERPAAERRADDEAARSALEQALRIRGQRAPCEPQDWRIAKARVEDALAEQDRLYTVAQELEDAGAARDEVKAANDELEQFSTYGPWRAMMDTPAPSIEAVGYKLRALLDRGHADDVGDDVDTPETITKLLAEHPIDGAAPIARIYQDVLRLAGERPDIVAAQPTPDAEDLIDEYRAIGGQVQLTTTGGVCIGHPPTPSTRQDEIDMEFAKPDVIAAVRVELQRQCDEAMAEMAAAAAIPREMRRDQLKEAWIGDRDGLREHLRLSGEADREANLHAQTLAAE
jgi:hypothetical protein